MTDSTGNASGPTRRPGARIALGAGLALVAALAVLVAAFLSGVAIPGDFLRTPLEKALTAAFGMPARLEGPLRVRTGRVAMVSADTLVLADPSAPAGVAFARATKPAARIDLGALLRRAVALEEVTGERLELELARAADGRGNWVPIFAASPDGTPSAVTFAGISRLRVQTVQGNYRPRGNAEPVRLEIADLDGVLTAREPTTARGTARFSGHAIGFDLRTASLADLQSSNGPKPVQGTVQWSGARISLDGSVAPDGSAFDAAVEASADNADAALAALGVATRDAGSLDVRGRVRVTAVDASVADLVLKLGDSAASGSGHVAWGEPRTRLALDVAAQRIDLRPFREALWPTPGVNPAESAVETLERLATGADAHAKLSVTEVVGLVTTLRNVRVEGRAADRAVTARGDGVVSGTRTTATLDFDARKPTRVLSARVQGGRVSSGALPRGARQPGVSGTLGSIRGQLSAQGATPRELVTSAAGSVEARDVRWTFADREKRSIEGRFDLARLSVQGARAASVELSGRLAGDPCALKVSGGALGPLFEGERWPLKLAASCRGARLDASGPVMFGGPHIRADLAYNASAQRIGPAADVFFGIVPGAQYSGAARGTLVLDDNVARVKFDVLRLGRSTGTGQATVPLDTAVSPRLELAFTNADVEELIARAPAGEPAPSDPLSLAVLPANRRLPDVEFEVSADRAQLVGETLRRVRASGVVRDGRLPPARVGFEWRGAPVNAHIAADFRGARPTVSVDATAQNADLGALLARLGQAGIGMSAGTVQLRANTTGIELGDLLAAATIDATIARARFDRKERFATGLARRGDFSAQLKAAPDQPASLTARGMMDGEAFDLALETPGLAGLARRGASIPATLRVSLGDTRLQASGRVARDGTGDGRVDLSGERLDRLGVLVGVALPEAGRYSASGTVVLASDSIRASDLDASWGQSRVLGTVQVQRGDHPFYTATLRAPTLHLEDVGATRWLRERELNALEGNAGGPPAEGPAMERAIARLRASDIDASLDVESLRGGSEHFASGRASATLKAGLLHVALQDARTLSGRVDADVRVDASGAQPRVSVQARAENVEYEPVARALDPDTAMAGRLDAVIDLTAQGPPGNLIPALAGTADLAVYPRELRAGAIDFWGTGLLRTLLRTLDPGARSAVECAVSSWDIDAGVARSRAFFVDTTNVRIVGQVDIDLSTRALSGRLRPHSERPELITVAPTMVVGGSIGEPRVTVAPESVVLAPLRLATPLAGFALDWLGARGALATGAVACREAFDRARAARAAK